MKTLFAFFFLTFSILSAIGQNIPVDFESTGHGASWTWTTFENDSNPALEIVANPDFSGINSSSTVARFTALQTGQPFAGCETMHGADIGTFTIDASNSTIRIMVWKSTISDVGIKLVRADNWSLGEIKIANTKVNEWEQLTYDFSSHDGLTYDQIVVFPDFTSRANNNVIYFDNIFGEMVAPTAINDFEDAKVKVFPNPSSDKITIQSTQAIQEIKIYNITGELLIDKQELSTSSLDISHLPKGIYVVKARINEQTIVEKLIKN